MATTESRMDGGGTALAGTVLVLIVALLAHGPANAASDKPAAEKTGQRLEEVNRALDEGRQKTRALKKQAQHIQQELNRLRRDMVAAAHIIQEQEKRAGKLVRALTELKAKEDAKLAKLTARRGQLAGVLVALQRVARYPPEALITQPMPPADTVRSAILLRAAVPEIEHRAARLRDDLETLVQARREILEKRAQFVEVTTGLERERKRLAALYGQKTALKHRTLAQQRAAARRVKSLAAEAASLRELLDRLGDARPGSRLPRLAPDTGSPEPAPDAPGAVVGLPDGLTGTPITARRGKLPPPAVGRIVGRYGQTSGSGLTRKGMTLETAAGAQVVAPYEGRVVFAGPFRGYGELLIIEHGEGYHSLLAGLARIDSTMGQWVVAGEPVGVMGRPDGRKPVLYVELRRNGQPINPLPWLAAQR